MLSNQTANKLLINRFCFHPFFSEGKWSYQSKAFFYNLVDQKLSLLMTSIWKALVNYLLTTNKAIINPFAKGSLFALVLC